MVQVLNAMILRTARKGPMPILTDTRSGHMMRMIWLRSRMARNSNGKSLHITYGTLACHSKTQTTHT